MRIREYASWEKIMAKAETFFREIQESDVICLVHHGDADGVTSALYVYYTILQIRGRVPDHVLWVSTKSYDMKKEGKLIKNINPDLLIVVDLDLLKDEVLLNNWSLNIKKIFIYDHHSISIDVNLIPNNIIYLNARMLNQEGVWHPASYFGYSISKCFFDNEDYNWVGAVGLRGDHAHNDYPELFERVKEKFPILFLEVVGKDYNYILEGLTHYVNAGFFYSPDLREKTSFLALQKAWEKKDPMLFFEGDDPVFQELRRKSDEIKKEINVLFEKAKQEAYRPEGLDLVLGKVNTPHYIVGVIAGKICKDEPGIIAVIANEYDENMGIELRMGKNTSCNLVELLMRMKDNFNFISAGGHPVAAGCLIHPSQYEEFAQKLENVYREYLKRG